MHCLLVALSIEGHSTLGRRAGTADIARRTSGTIGVSRFQLLLGFAREVGITPHAYLVQRRVRVVRRLLAAGRSPVDAALLAGFADQSHT
jgi:AraC-like DNA-binding protein